MRSVRIVYADPKGPRRKPKTLTTPTAWYFPRIEDVMRLMRSLRALTTFDAKLGQDVHLAHSNWIEIARLLIEAQKVPIFPDIPSALTRQQ